MRENYIKLRRLLDHTEHENERNAILDAILPLGTYRQLKNLYGEIDDEDEKDKIFHAMLRAGSYHQLRKFLQETEYEEERDAIINAMLPLGTYRQLMNLCDEAYSEEEEHKIRNAMLSTRISSLKPSEKNRASLDKQYDLFIAHASEDKDFATPLASFLRGEGIKVWYDDFVLQVGDSLRRGIDQGLAQSRYGVVVLSEHFFQKHWPQKELDGLAAKEELNRRVILPVWHNIDRDTVIEYSPTLADIKATKSSQGIRAVGKEILQRLSRRLP